MYAMYKILRGFIKALVSAAAPWQIAAAAALGTLLGFMPLWLSGGPSPLACAILLVAIVVNCHLGTVFVFWGLMKLLSFACDPVALLVGNGLDGLAQAAAGSGALHASGWAHTGWLGMAVIGLLLAPLAAFAMARVTVLFRTRLRDRLLANRQLALAGKIGGNGFVARAALWFFDL